MGSFTTIGTRKVSNQDSFCFLEAGTAYGEVALAAICDGVGGLANGELASASVIRRFSDWFEEDCPRFLAENVDAGVVDLSGLQQEWGDVLAQLNNDIRIFGADNDTTLGTTFTGLFVCQGTCFVAHVGDCRAYRFTSNGCKILTRDQTLAAREVAQGVLTAEEAVGHKHSSVLIQAVGTQGQVVPDYFTCDAPEGFLFVLCCDGFYRSLPEERLTKGFFELLGANEAMMNATCERLSQESMDAGSSDNVTVLCFSDGLGSGPSWDDSTTTTLGSNDEATGALSAVAGNVMPDDEATLDLSLRLSPEEVAR